MNPVIPGLTRIQQTGIQQTDMTFVLFAPRLNKCIN